jgi:hypothetical protein
VRGVWGTHSRDDGLVFGPEDNNLSMVTAAFLDEAFRGFEA